MIKTIRRKELRYMLKIKDDVDLKELEKFGFKYDKEMNYYYKHCLGTFNKFIVLIEEDIDSFRGQIVLYNDSAFNTTLYMSTLYDLITAGLVEKIEE